MNKFVGVVCVGLALVSCEQVRAVQQAGAAKAQVEAAVVVAQSDVPILTKAQAAACAGQSVFNALTTYLKARGNAAAAQYASLGSAVAGGGCEWRE